MVNVEDKRSDFFSSCFEKALPYEEYLKTGSDLQIERWKQMEQSVKVTQTQQQLLGSFVRKMNVLVMSGIWCGDCVRQGPIINAIQSFSPTMEVRYIDNQENPELRDELRIHGGCRVPVVVTLSEDFFEVGRFGDRTLSVYRQKAVREVGPTCDIGLSAPSEDALAVETQEWLDYFERMHLILRLSGLLRERYSD